MRPIRTTLLAIRPGALVPVILEQPAIETDESYNGIRGGGGQGNFTQWFSDNAFGGTVYTNYECTPVGAVSHTDEPGANVNFAPTYFGLWAQGKSFAICAWYSRRTERFQAVGDPFVTR